MIAVGKKRLLTVTNSDPILVRDKNSTSLFAHKTSKIVDNQNEQTNANDWCQDDRVFALLDVDPLNQAVDHREAICKTMNNSVVTQTSTGNRLLWTAYKNGEKSYSLANVVIWVWIALSAAFWFINDSLVLKTVSICSSTRISELKKERRTRL